MAGVPFYYQALDGNGDPYNGAKLYAKVANTSTDAAMYTTAALATETTNPAISNAWGILVVYLDSTVTYDLTVKSPDDATTVLELEGYTPGTSNLFPQAPVIATLTAAKALAAASYALIYVEGRASDGDGYQGFFRWDASDLSTEVTADTENGLYIPPNSDTDGSSGAWVRVGDWKKTGLFVSWFGADFVTATNAACALGFQIVNIGQGLFSFASDITVPRGVTLRGAGISTTTLVQTSNASIIVGGSASTTRDVWLEDMQINGQTSGTAPIVIYDRCSYSGARRVLVANVDAEGFALGTSANPSATTQIRLFETQVLCNASGASAARIHGGGGFWFIDFNAQGGNGLEQTVIDVNNTANVDGIIIQGNLTGDCDYGFRWRGSANCSNVFAMRASWDRCGRGAIVAEPTGTPGAEVWCFEAGTFGGLGPTTGTDYPLIHLNIGSGINFRYLKVSGLAGGARVETVKFEGAGTISDVDLSGFQIADGARAGAATYAAVYDATTSGVTRLHTMGMEISAGSSTYTYGIRVDTLGTGTVIGNLRLATIHGAATADINVAGTAYSAGRGSFFDEANATLYGGSNVGMQHDTGDTYAYNKASNYWRWTVGSSTLANLSTSGLEVETFVVPLTDDAYDLGTASNRWDDVYATNTTIQTSDEREKSTLEPLPDGVKRAVRAIMANVGAFRWLSAVAEKGDDARLHIGVTAQAVMAAFAAEGEDPACWGLFCADPIVDVIYEPNGRRTEVPRLDEAGNPYVRLGVRYGELHTLALAVLFEDMAALSIQ